MSKIQMHIAWRITPFYRYWPRHWGKPARRWIAPIQFVAKVVYWAWPVSWWVITKGDGGAFVGGEEGYYISANDAAVGMCEMYAREKEDA